MHRITVELASFAAVIFFSVSGSLIFRAVRKPRKLAGNDSPRS
jgi:hypothetical protein